MPAKINKLNLFLANLAVLNIKVHNLHWNVIGPEFMQIHKMTEDIYKMLQVQFDTVAETMKMQGKFPMATTAEYVKNATIKEVKSRDFQVYEVLEELDNDCGIIMDLAKEIRDEADENDNFQIANLFEDYLDVYSKQAWMIKSMLQEDVEGIEDDSDE